MAYEPYQTMAELQEFRKPPPPGHVLSWNPALPQAELRALRLARLTKAQRLEQLDPTVYDKKTGARLVWSFGSPRG